MRKPLQGLLALMLGAAAVGCVSNTADKSTRAPSSAAEPVVWRDPSTQKSFWDEFQAAEDGMDEQDQSSSEFKIGVLFKWLRANPRAAIEDLRRQGPVIAIPIVKKSFRREGEKVFVVVGTNEILQVLSRVDERSDFRPFAHRLGSDEHFRTRWGAQDPTAWKTETWNALAKELLDRESYVGRNMDGRFYGRVDFVNQIGRKFAQSVNERIIGFGGLSSRNWTEVSRALIDELYFNPLGLKGVQSNAGNALAPLREALELQLSKGGTAGDTQLATYRASAGPKPEGAEYQAFLSYLSHELASAEITQAQAAHALDQLFAHGQIERARAALESGRPGEFESYVKEALRFQPWISYLSTRAAKDLSIGSTRIPQDARVILLTAAVNFDPAVIESPNEFKASRWERAADPKFASLPLPFSDAGADRLRPTTFREAVTILREIIRQPGLRRVEGHFGQLDHRMVFVPGKLKDIYRFSLPEHLSVEYDVAAARSRFEIPDKDYPYEEYLQDYDRNAFRQCLGGLSKLNPMDESEAGSFWRNMRELGRILKQTPAIVRSFAVTRKNRNQENKHLFFCRLPAKYRDCLAGHKIDIQTDFGPKHRQAFESCRSHLKGNESLFYGTVFFGEDLDFKQVTFEQARRPRDPAYEFEDQIKFYSRYRARESMMNPAGFTMPVPKMLFYVRLNIDFRMCIGGPVLKHKFTLGREGVPKEEQYEICKNGVFNPQTFKHEGALTLVEKYYYESIMLDRQVTLDDIRRKEGAR